MRAFASRVLSDLGYAVLAAPGAAVTLALSAAHPGPLDLLLPHVVMPLTSGRELAERLSIERPEVRVLYMSGYAEMHLGRTDALARAVREALDPAAGGDSAGS